MEEYKYRKVQILGTIDDLVAAFLWYDRKEDEDLPRGVIEETVKNGEITVPEMVSRFRLALIGRLKLCAHGGTAYALS